MNSDFKATDIEVGFASVDRPLFRKLRVAEIEQVLAEMQEGLRSPLLCVCVRARAFKSSFMLLEYIY